MRHRRLTRGRHALCQWKNLKNHIHILDCSRHDITYSKFSDGELLPCSPYHHHRTTYFGVKYLFWSDCFFFRTGFSFFFSPFSGEEKKNMENFQRRLGLTFYPKQFLWWWYGLSQQFSAVRFWIPWQEQSRPKIIIIIIGHLDCSTQMRSWGYHSRNKKRREHESLFYSRHRSILRASELVPVLVLSISIFNNLQHVQGGKEVFLEWGLPL